MATYFMAKFGYMRLFGREMFENGLQYRHLDSKIFNGNGVDTTAPSGLYARLCHAFLVSFSLLPIRFR